MKAMRVVALGLVVVAVVLIAWAVRARSQPTSMPGAVHELLTTGDGYHGTVCQEDEALVLAVSRNMWVCMNYETLYFDEDARPIE